ncbi:MAG: Cof-type HAD-IIB family hydrolase [Chthoniobacterales bacterium]
MINEPASRKSAVRLFAIDVDGTLLDSSHRLGAEVRDAVCRLAGSGVQVVLATARGPQAVRDIVRQFDFSPKLICFSGAWIGELDPQSLEPKYVLLDRRMPGDVARSVIATALAHKVEPNVLTPESWRVRALTDEISEECAILNQRPVVTDKLLGNNEEPSKIMLISSLEEAPSTLPQIAAVVGAAVGAAFSKPNYLEILPIGVNKAKALSILADALGLELSQVAGIGDAPNDLEMLSAVGLAFAMGNASDRVKAAADSVVGSNDEGGVARAVAQILTHNNVN